MTIERLISFPVVPVFQDNFMQAFINGEVASETLFKYGKVYDLRSTISVRLYQNAEDPVFVLGEALQSIEDDFSKDVGRKIADGRAKSLKEYDEDLHWIKFTLSEAETMVEDFLERRENDKPILVSSVKLPISELALPHGIVNRLKMLISKD